MEKKALLVYGNHLKKDKPEEFNKNRDLNKGERKNA